MADAISQLVWIGLLSSPIIVVYTIVVTILIRKRKRFAWVLALAIAGIGISFVSVYATPKNEFAGEIAASVWCLSLSLGVPLVLLVAFLSRKNSY
jgi:hypothetical protein